jgi:hypothetical protein
MHGFFLFQVEDPGLWTGEDENFNHPDGNSTGTGIHTLSISRIKICAF